MDEMETDRIEEATQLLSALVRRSRLGSQEAFVTWVTAFADSVEREVMVSGAMLIEYSKAGTDKKPQIEVSSRQGVARNF